MSNPDDVSSRLSSALDEILKGTPQLPDDDRPPAAAQPQPEPPRPEPGVWALPEIVPATADIPVLPDVAPAPTIPAPPVATAVVPAVPVVAPAPAPLTPRPAQPAAPTTGWGDHLPQQSSAGTQQLRAPGRRPRVRRVTRVVRHIDPWSTFKLALVFSLVGYVIALTSGVLLWRVADSTGTLDNVERWFTQFGWETFEFDGSAIFHDAWVIGLFVAVGLTGAAVLMATLFNLVSDIVGGIRVTVLEEEVVERTASSARRYVVRRPPLGAAAGTSWDVDDPEPPAGAPSAGSTAPAAVPPTSTEALGGTWSIDDDEPA